MMKIIFAFVVTVACVLAQTIPENMCSVQAIGDAVLNNGHHYDVNMTRVKNFVRYQMKIQNLFSFSGAVISRPDVENGKGRTYSYLAGGSCQEFPILALSQYHHVQDKQFSGSVTSGDYTLTGSITFDGSNKLSSEVLQISDGSSTNKIEITYSSVNYDFENNDATLFQADSRWKCSDQSSTTAPSSKTSIQCYNTPSSSGTPSGSNTPSSTTSGGSNTPSSTAPSSTAPGTSSSSSMSSNSSSHKKYPASASIALPSAILLVIAVVALL